MSTMVATSSRLETVADLVERLGGVPLDRIRFRPSCGAATVQAVLEMLEKEHRICELVDGVLVEKPMGFMESQLALHLATLLKHFIDARNLGLLTGADGTIQIAPNLVRIPDVAFFS